jgi:hypothetical protein
MTNAAIGGDTESEEATVAEMRCGCERVDSFGGYEKRCGEAASSMTGRVHVQRWTGSRGRLHRRASRNAANPRIGSRTQQACKPVRGANRRGRAKRRGRMRVEVQHLGSEAVETPWKAQTRQVKSMEGSGAKAPTNPRRGRSATADRGQRSGRQRCPPFERGTKPTRADPSQASERT